MQTADEFVSGLVPEREFDFDIGDTVDVHVKIEEGDKSRIQIFNGIVIRTQGQGIRKTVTVRRVVQAEGVERIFPLASPNVVDIVTKKKGKIRRARLYYLRDKVGKATRVKERRWAKAGGKKAKPAPAASSDDEAASGKEPGPEAESDG
jgi:large subunit ribosomal protein L19